MTLRTKIEEAITNAVVNLSADLIHDSLYIHEEPRRGLVAKELTDQICTIFKEELEVAYGKIDHLFTHVAYDIDDRLEQNLREPIISLIKSLEKGE